MHMDIRSTTDSRRRPSELARRSEQAAADRARQVFAAAVERVVAEGRLRRDVSSQSEIEMLEHATALTTQK